MKERKAYSTKAILLVERERRLKCKVILANPNLPTNPTFAKREVKISERSAITY